MSTMDNIVGGVMAAIFLYVIYLLLRDTKGIKDNQCQDEQIELLGQKLLKRKLEILSLMNRIRILEYQNEQLRKGSSGNSKE